MLPSILPRMLPVKAIYGAVAFGANGQCKVASLYTDTDCNCIAKCTNVQPLGLAFDPTSNGVAEHEKCYRANCRSRDQGRHLYNSAS